VREGPYSSREEFRLAFMVGVSRIMLLRCQEYFLSIVTSHGVGIGRTEERYGTLFISDTMSLGSWCVKFRALAFVAPFYTQV
jgi:hypothetical protein